MVLPHGIKNKEVIGDFVTTFSQIVLAALISQIMFYELLLELGSMTHNIARNGVVQLGITRPVCESMELSSTVRSVQQKVTLLLVRAVQCSKE